MMPTHFKGTKEEELALDTYIKLTRSVNALESRLTQRGQIEDLTTSQFGVLETLFHLGPLCPGELSSKLLKSTGNMTLVLDNLEKRNLVRRVRETGDRRQIHVHLTPEGEALIQRIFPLQAQAITSEMSALSADEQRQLGMLCRKLGKKA
jgi:MarR family transcriptional regulator, 2-MHQ and catechol-resistance regulon repressor